MRAYQFIKYHENTSLDKLIANTVGDTVLCFDFEDSIQDFLIPSNTSFLKALYRNYFKKIIGHCKQDLSRITIGIRINAINSPEFSSDIEVLSCIKHISSIFLPKSHGAEQIHKLEICLKENGISYNEIIPVIETRSGMDNVDHVLKYKSDKIFRIAFGHCDYNNDNKIYPFFHQNSREYWSWITKLNEILRPYHVGLINSPFLQLDNGVFFTTMLSVLNSICDDNCSQITLTEKQSKLCHIFSNHPAEFISPTIPNKLDLRVNESVADEFIESFENANHQKGFSVSKERILLSPQEYLASLRFKNKSDYPEVHLTFAGGCFPVQGNIPFEKLFHQILKNKVEGKADIKLNINIIRYERFQNCMEKIAGYKQLNSIHILVFSIRPEPILRQAKLFYRYRHKSDKRTKWALNIPLRKQVIAENYDLPPTDNRFNPHPAKDISSLHKAFLNLNYLLGSLLGADNKAMKQYLRLIAEVIRFCKSNGIHPVLMGPPVRTNAFMERILSVKLDRFMRSKLIHEDVDYVTGSDLIKDGIPLFSANGIYANEEYHALIAEKLNFQVLPVVEKMMKNIGQLPRVSDQIVTNPKLLKYTKQAI